VQKEEEGGDEEVKEKAGQDDKRFISFYFYSLSGSWGWRHLGPFA